MKRASYREAVDWIATNDNADSDDTAEDIAGYISTVLVADLFRVNALRVGTDVARVRAKYRAEAAAWAARANVGA